MKTNSYTPNNISRREQEVLRLIAEEHNSHQIAEELCVSYETAQSHRKSLRKKLKVKNTAGMIRVAFERGILNLSGIASIAILLIFSTSLDAQNLNNEKINYQVRTKAFSWNLATDDGGNSESEIVFDVKMKEDDNDATTDLQNVTTQSPLCFTYQDDCPDDCFRSKSHLFPVVNNATTFAYDLHIRSWEDDNDHDCPSESGDDNVSGHRLLRYPKSKGGPGVWHFNNYTSGNSSIMDWEVVWRYVNGDTKNSAFNFGELNSSTVSHLNGNRAKPDNDASSSTGYTNQWTSSSGIDVFYKFSIPSEGRKVIISKSTSSSLRLRLLESSTNGTSTGQITSSTSSITRQLCGGTYYVVVDGTSSSQQGDFTLFINPEPIDITPGSHNTSTISVCKGASIGSISNIGSAISSNRSVTYQWFKQASNESFPGSPVGPSSPSATSLSSADAGTMPNDNAVTSVRFRRRAQVCGSNTVYTSSKLFNKSASSIEGGSIEFDGDVATVTGEYTLPIVLSNTPTGIFKSVVDASGTPGPTTIVYQVKKGSGDFEDVVGTAGQDWSPGANNDNPFTSSGEYHVRRKVTNGCDSPDFSNTIDIKVRSNLVLGSISGKVTTSNGGQVASVNVTAVLNNASAVQGASYTMNTYSAVTGTDGIYTIPNIYYGSDNDIANFTITPELTVMGTVHEFSPTSLSRDISASSKTKTAVNFTDNTSLDISGKVAQLFDPGSGNLLCGMDTVAILVGTDLNTAIPVDSTNALGEYTISVPSPGDYIIMAKYKDHIFAMDYAGATNGGKIVVNSDLQELHFRSTNMSTISGKLTDGCGEPIGEATIRFQDFNNCWTKDVATVNNGEFSVSLPSREYKIFAINHPNALVNSFFEAAQFVDLSESDTTGYNLKYRAQPVVSISGLPPDLGCRGGGAVDENGNPDGNPDPYLFVPNLEQVSVYPYTIEIKELALDGAPNTCAVDTGTVKIDDDIGGRGLVEIQFKGGIAKDTIIPTEPYLIEPFLKLMSMTARDTVQKTLDAEVLNQQALVTGARATASNNVLVTPELPMMILRDPPGDQSFAFVENTETHEVSTKMYTLKGGSNNKWGKVKIGSKFEAGFIGFDVETKIWNNQQLDIKHGNRNISTDESVITTSTSSRFQTSSSPLIVGDDGDLVIGASMVMNYSTAEIISLDGCEAKRTKDIIVSPKAVKTQYFLRTGFIRDQTIPKLEQLIANPPVQDSLPFYKDQVRIWKHILMYNDSLKAEAIPYVSGSDENGGGVPPNLTLSDNASIEYSITSTSSKSLTTEFITEIDKDVANEIGAEIAGVGPSGGYLVNFKTEKGKTNATTNTSTFKSGFLLLDDDVGDGFNISVLSDPVFKTPIFKLNSGQTSCPWEPGTQKRDSPQLTALDPIQSNIPNGTVRTFNFELGNTGETTDPFRNYFVKAINETLGGARVEFQNVVDQKYKVDLNSSVNLEVNISQFSNPSDDFAFEGIEFIAVPFCEKDFENFQIVDNALVSAFYTSPCTDIAMAEPIDDWVINSNMTTIPIKFNDYTKAGLTEVQVEYLEVGTTNWINALVIPADLILANVPSPNGANLGTTVQFDATNIPDGEYYIRVKAVCTNGIVNYSIRAKGIKDTKAPELLGLALPIDDIYDSAADIIATQFDEVVKAENLSNARLEFLRLDDANGDMGEYAASFQLFNNSASIVPSQFIANTNLFFPGAYRVVLHDIEDLYGNVAEPLSWVFITPGYEIDDECSVLDIANNNSNQDAISTNNYRAISITSNGKVRGAGETRYLATTQIELVENFEVEAGGEFLAEIFPCEEDLCGDVISSSGQANAPSEYLDWQVAEEGGCVSGILTYTANNIFGNIYIHVKDFVDATQAEVEVDLYKREDFFGTVVLDSTGLTESMGSYTTAGGEVYDVEIVLDYIDGTNNSKIVVATVKMYPQTTF